MSALLSNNSILLKTKILLDIKIKEICRKIEDEIETSFSLPRKWCKEEEPPVRRPDRLRSGDDDDLPMSGGLKCVT